MSGNDDCYEDNTRQGRSSDGAWIVPELGAKQWKGAKLMRSGVGENKQQAEQTQSAKTLTLKVQFVKGQKSRLCG